MKKNRLLKKKCECPHTSIQNTLSSAIGYLSEEELGRIHKPYKCKGTYELKKYKVGMREL